MRIHAVGLLGANKTMLTIVIISFLIISSCSQPPEAIQPSATMATTNLLMATPSPTETLATLPSHQPLPLAPLSVENKDLAGTVLRAICLNIKEDYPDMQTPPNQDVVFDLKRLFSLNGITILKPGENCDALLEVSIIGRPISAKYGGNKICYTGAYTTGNLTLSLKDGRKIDQEIDYGISPPFVVTNCPEDTSSAPLKTTTAFGITEALTQIWGFDFLISPFQFGNTNFEGILYANVAAEVCLDHSNDIFEGKEEVLNCVVEIATMPNHYQSQALSALARFEEKALPVVPRLIALLQEHEIATPTPRPFTSSQRFTEEVVTALRSITGQDFGTDGSKWLDWWNSYETFIITGACTPGKTFIDEEGDVEEEYLDLLKVETYLENEVLTVVFFLTELPQRFHINQRGTGMEEGSIEYYWGVDIDADNNDATGIDGSWGIPAMGIDYRIVLFHYIHGDQEFGLIEQFLTTVDVMADDIKSQPANMSVDYEARTITLSSQIPGINESSQLHFLALKNLPDFEWFDDFLCE